MKLRCWIPVAVIVAAQIGCASRGGTSGQFAARGVGQGAAEQTFTQRITSAIAALKPQPKVYKAEDPISVFNGAKAGPEVHIASAEMLQRNGNVKDARAQYDLVLKESPNNFEALIGIARMHDRAGEYEQAVAAYQRALAAHPQQPAVHNDLGLCFARQQQFDMSLAALSQAVNLKPDSKLYRNNLAKVLVEVDRPHDALPHMTAAHGEAAGHYNLAVLLYEKNHHGLARDHAAMALQLDPKLTPAQALLAQLPAAQGTVQALPVSAPQPGFPSQDTESFRTTNLPPADEPLYGTEPYSAEPVVSPGQPNDNRSQANVTQAGKWRPGSGRNASSPVQSGGGLSPRVSDADPATEIRLPDGAAWQTPGEAQVPPDPYEFTP